MPRIKDFRSVPLNIANISTAGAYIGKQSYSKLYLIENIFRIIIHSVLSIQAPGNWWNIAVDATIQGKATRFKQQYISKVWHGNPGIHDIYYIDLKDLNEIIRANRNLFDPIIPDLDKWIVNIEDIRIPRNIISHMNFPNETDQMRIDVFFNDCKQLLNSLSTRLTLLIP